MSTLTAFASAGAMIQCTNPSSWTTARSGAGTLTGINSGFEERVGATNGGGANYVCYISFLTFDTSSIGSGGVLSSATLSMWGPSLDQSLTDFVFELYAQSWGSTLDFVSNFEWYDPVSYSVTNLLASFPTSSLPSTSFPAYNAFTSNGSALMNSINKTGSTRYIMISDRNRANTTPATDEYASFSSDDASGTANDPKLVVNYTVVPQAPTLNSVVENATKPRVDVAWTAPGAGDPPTGYKVTRAEDSGFTVNVVTTTLGNVTSWQDTTTSYGTTYWYKVLGTNSVGDGPYSSSLSVTTSAAPRNPMGQRLTTRVARFRAAHR